MNMAKELIKAPDSTSVWESNLKKMREIQPQLAAIVDFWVQEHGHEFAHYENKTPSGTWVEGLSKDPFFQQDEDPTVGWTRKDRDVPVFFQYGIGTPPYLFKVIRSLPKEAMALIVVEPNIDLLAYVMHLTSVYTAMPGNATLVFITAPDEKPEGLELRWTSPKDPTKQDDDDSEKTLTPAELMERSIRSEALNASIVSQGLFTAMLARTAIHRGEEEAFRDKMNSMAHDIREWIVTQLGYLGNSSEDTMLGLRQMALMAPWMVYGQQYRMLAENFKGRPFIIVSAGPSLKKNIEHLKDVGDKAVIIANDATLEPLLSAGIKPHIVCCLERGMSTYDHFFRRTPRDRRDDCKDILLICQAVSIPRIYGTWPGPKVLVGKAEVPVDQWFIMKTLDSSAVDSGSSVAHMCLGAAADLGASSVALVGQDLAYGENGVTHVKGVYTESSEKMIKRFIDRSSRYRVRSIDGGEVTTTETWVQFLRMFEARIPTYDMTTYDCTEGGALIKGTVIMPLADYIAANVADLEAMPKTPAQVIRESGGVMDRDHRAARFDEIRPRIEAARKDMEVAAEIIVELAKSLDKVSAPGIPTQRRVENAAYSASLIDKLNSINRMFAFVAQSYLYLSTADIATTRFLDSVDRIERWMDIHREIVSGHIAVARFITRWLDYAEGALSYYTDHELAIEPYPKESSYSRFEKVKDELGEGEDQTALCCEMDQIFTMCDIVADEWPPEAQWACAMFLLKEGRAQEALAIMHEVNRQFEGRELPTDTIFSFFKDFSRVVMAGDLCHIPDYSYSKLILKNAESVGGEDDEVRAIKQEIEDKERSYYVEFGVLAGAYRRDKLNTWYAERRKAEDAMLNNEPLKAFQIIWDAIKNVGVDVPSIARPNLQWLVKQLDKFLDADDDKVKPVVDGILDSMATSPEVMKTVTIGFSLRFLKALQDHGANIILPSAEDIMKAIRGHQTTAS